MNIKGTARRRGYGGLRNRGAGPRRTRVRQRCTCLERARAVRLLLEVLGGPKRGERRRRRLHAHWVLRQRVPAQVQRRLEAAPACGAHHRLRLVDQAHVLAQVGRVAVTPTALRAPHAARAARAARCQQHQFALRHAPPTTLPPPHPASNANRTGQHETAAAPEHFVVNGLLQMPSRVIALPKR
ncbi:unnamed protein product, partial [Iphiclides podalirius]